MSRTKDVFYAIWIIILMGALVFFSVGIYKYVEAKKYVAVDDKVYTFSEITGISAEDEILKAEWTNFEVYGADRVFEETSIEKLRKIETLLFEMKFVPNAIELKGTSTCVKIYLADESEVSMYYRNVSNVFIVNGKKYKVTGLNNFEEVLTIIQE